MYFDILLLYILGFRHIRLYCGCRRHAFGMPSAPNQPPNADEEHPKAV